MKPNAAARTLALSLVVLAAGAGLLQADCSLTSIEYAHIDNAIAAVVAARFGTEPEVVPSPMVRTCGDYSDCLGHLTAEGAAAGQTIGESYRSIDGPCP